MTNRRRLLLSYLANSFKFLPYSYDYLYYGLVPEKVNKNKNLPNTYQEVEYIESSGTQYINTGYKPTTENMVVECKFKLPNAINSLSLFGSNASSYPYFLTPYHSDGYGDKVFKHWVGTNGGLIAIALNEINNVKYTINNGTLTCNYNGSQTSGSYPGSIQSGYNIYIFGKNNAGSSAERSNGYTLYSFKLYDNNTLVRDFVPCYRKSDNVIGLFDLVNKVFYTNAGSGTFTKGNDVYRTVKNKAKVNKLYGNSVVENQLVQNGNFEDTSGWSGYNGTISVSNNILSYSISYLGGDYGSNRIEQQFTNINNHYYLVDVYIKTPYATTVRLYTGEWIILGTTNANQWTRFTQIFEKTGSSVGNNSLYFDVHGQASYQVGDVIQVKQYQKKDITQRYPFDTPTTLTDNRVQAIINRGYIPYNLGELKSVDIGEISSEPYNLFDEELKQGDPNGSQATVVSSKDYINIVAGTTYTLEATSSVSIYLAICKFYDDNNTLVKEIVRTISSTSINVNDYVAPNNATKCKLQLNTSGANLTPTNVSNTCFHRTGTRTGYAPYKSPQTITFKYQGSGVGTAHDTYELTKTSHVFTKNIVKVVLGSYDWVYENVASGDNYYSGIVENALKYSGVLCEKYVCDMSVSPSTKRNNVWISQSGRINITADGYNGNVNNFKNDTKDVELEYQLATPQVITIPRKHLGVVRIRDLSWTSQTAYGTKEFYNNTLMSVVAKPSANDQIANIYSSNFMTTYRSNGTANSGIAVGTNGLIVIKCTDNDTDFLNKYGDYLIFYETDSEVSDITDTFDIQSGGTINTNWFTWVENQLLANSNFANGRTDWQYNTEVVAQDNYITVKPTANWQGIYQPTNNAIAGHKYFIYAHVKKANGNTIFCLQIGSNTENAVQTNETTKQLVYHFENNITLASSNYIYLRERGNYADFDVYDFQCIDLTVGFGAGNEPTDINDYRIQYILKYGYIPTNLTGTEKHVQNEVLANVDFLMKGK